MRLFAFEDNVQRRQMEYFFKIFEKNGKIHFRSKKSYLLKLLKMKTFKITLCRKVKLLRFRKNDLSAL